jgi:transcriptional regulator with XRE-family HTH domain
MRSTIKIRELFNISQQQLAIFLGVPRSHLALAETGRRHLSTRALMQLARLELALHNNTEYPLPEIPETAKNQAHKGLAAMKAHAKACEQEALWQAASNWQPCRPNTSAAQKRCWLWAICCNR